VLWNSRAIAGQDLQKLTKIGLLQSLPGTNGGYRLARDANRITALEVIRAIDGPIILTACFTAHGECDQSEKMHRSRAVAQSS